MSTARIVGGILPGELLDLLTSGELPGLAPADYGLADSDTLSAAASRAWPTLLAAYQAFRTETEKLSDSDPGIGLTRDKWLLILLSHLGFGRIPVTPGGHLSVGAGDEATDYPVSHLWQDIPVHLMGWNVNLDAPNRGVPGAARAPQSMVQELLNREPDNLWATLSNGRVLRLLRDSSNLVGQAYVEFDLQSMFDGELFADFVTLFTLAHATRLERRPGDYGQPGAVVDRWIERWRSDAIATGTRALTRLRGQVELALEVLGTGFLQAPANQQLRDRLTSGEITPADMQRALLRLVYRLLFWTVTEDRGVLLHPDADATAKQRYAKYFSSARLRRLARTRIGTRHTDLWEQTRLVFASLGRDGGAPELGLPGLGGLFETTELDVLNTADLSNAALLKAMRLLSTTTDPQSKALRSVDFAHLGAEELGGIYEGLLELHPRIDTAERTYSLSAGAGNERKTTGSYYTPTPLVDLVIDTALDPVLDRATSTGTPAEQEAALLALRVCDPACGSGHFLVAAARRIAHRVAQVRNKESEPTPAQAQEALHDVVRQCIYGVDLNPTAAELAKVSLWLEAIEPGRPLGFLDAHIRVGNSLIGATPALVAAGIPDGAFTAITGDDRATVNAWKRTNRRERDAREGGEQQILGLADAMPDNARAAKGLKELAAQDALSLEDVALQRRRYEELRESPELQRAKAAADAWTAAFFQVKQPGAAAITSSAVFDLEDGAPVASEIREEVEHLTAAHRFFHWHVEYPDIFSTSGQEDDPQNGWSGGFDVMLGNPPWETVQMSDKEFFAGRDPEIANAPTAAKRKTMIAALAQSNPRLLTEYQSDLRDSEGTNLFVRGSGRFPLTARGKTNTYAVFAETFRNFLTPTGRAGVLTPTGIATDETTSVFLADTIRNKQLAAFFDFENRQKLFENVDSRFRMAVSAFAGRAGYLGDVPMAFMLQSVADAPSRSYALTADEILLLNPNSGTLPAFATRRDADITIGIYQRLPILILDGHSKGNPWELSFRQGLFNMSNDSHHFRTAEDLEGLGAHFKGWAWVKEHGYGQRQRWLPLYEAKQLGFYDHRVADVVKSTTALQRQNQPRPLSDEDKGNSGREAIGLYWVEESVVQERLGHYDRGYLIGWTDVTSSTNWRTMIPASLPTSAVGHTFPVVLSSLDPVKFPLQTLWSSLAFDYVARQKISGNHMTYGYLKQVAAPTPKQLFASLATYVIEPESWLAARTLELTFTSDLMAPYGHDLAGIGRPFRWIPERRTLIQAELDAAMMHVYGLERSEIEHVLDSFAVLRRYEERDHGEFRTKRLVLKYYDLMAQASASGVPYETPIDPPPGQGPRHPANSKSHEGSTP